MISLTRPWLHAQKTDIESQAGFLLEWDRLDGRRAFRISVATRGSTEDSPEDLAMLREWHIQKLLVFKRIFAPLVKVGVKRTHV